MNLFRIKAHDLCLHWHMLSWHNNVLRQKSTVLEQSVVTKLQLYVSLEAIMHTDSWVSRFVRFQNRMYIWKVYIENILDYVTNTLVSCKSDVSPEIITK
jgi:hypothetical protein